MQRSGVAGGVIAQDAFKEHFLMDEGGFVDSSKVQNVSGTVVSVLQAGAFFGALGSAPVSCEHHLLLSPRSMLFLSVSEEFIISHSSAFLSARI